MGMIPCSFDTPFLLVFVQFFAIQGRVFQVILPKPLPPQIWSPPPPPCSPPYKIRVLNPPFPFLECMGATCQLLFSFSPMVLIFMNHSFQTIPLSRDYIFLDACGWIESQGNPPPHFFFGFLLFHFPPFPLTPLPSPPRPNPSPYLELYP